MKSDIYRIEGARLLFDIEYEEVNGRTNIKLPSEVNREYRFAFDKDGTIYVSKDGLHFDEVAMDVMVGGKMTRKLEDD